MARESYQDRVIWITGASTGIGRACALEFARRGARVALSARSKEGLDALVAEIESEHQRKSGEGATASNPPANPPRPPRAIALPLDVTDRAANHEAVARIEATFGSLDVAFLNAGICEYVDARCFDADTFERQMRVNYMGIVYGVEAALPALRRSRLPRIVGMSSTAATGGLPRGMAYAATKAAVKLFMESLRIDLLRERIPVTVVCPGFVRTPLTDKNDFPMPLIMPAERAARIVADGIARGAYEISFPKIFSRTFKWIAMLPGPAYVAIMGRLVKR